MPRILVADDNSNIQKMVALAFEERGIDVVSVGNGEAAVRRIPDLAPDLVLADVFMPVRNGYEVCEFVKKDERFSHVPVILLVGAFDPLDEKEARRVGADGVLKKPFIPPDPLIAMVMSALEKNPKLAAELAKAREVPTAPPPEPLPAALEPPARVEPKPLPEFPEPTPEEAAAIYGFGKGRPIADQQPVPPKYDGQAEEEEFEGSSTTSDWRRNTANFEVPKELGAFTPGESFDSAFPSERNLPPRHVSAIDDEDAAERVEETASLLDMPVASAPQPVPAVLMPPASPAPLVPVAKSTELIAPAAVLPLVENKPERISKPVEQALTPAVEQEKEVKPQPPQPVVKPKSRSNSWLDMISSPSEYGSGWMSAIFGGKSKNKSEEPEGALEEKAEANVEEKGAQAVKPTESAVPPQTILAAAEKSAAETEAAPPPQPPVSLYTPPKGAFVEDESHKPPIKQDGNEFFAKGAPASDSASVASSPSLPSEPPAAEYTPFVVSAEVPEELLSAPADTTALRKEPDLEEPPAPNVTPEPLLVDDNAPTEVSPFSGAPELPVPLHAMLTPDEPEPLNASLALQQPEPAHVVSTLQEPEPLDEVPAPQQPQRSNELLPPLPTEILDEFAGDDPAIHEAIGGTIFAASEVPTVPEADEERIPTTPPPNREALADIPFLTPPPPAAYPAAESHPQESPAVDVDAIVAKVLAKLEPQLHEVLAQGLLKPLVENLMRDELENKTK